MSGLEALGQVGSCCCWLQAMLLVRAHMDDRPCLAVKYTQYMLSCPSLYVVAIYAWLTIGLLWVDE